MDQEGIGDGEGVEGLYNDPEQREQQMSMKKRIIFAILIVGSLLAFYLWYPAVDEIQSSV